MVIWAKLSKSAIASQALDLGPDRLEAEFQHFSMSWTARRPQLRLGLGQRQLETGFSRLPRPLIRGQLRLERPGALRFFLLRLHRLALESSSHSI